jgi:hypothetical protein
MVARLDARVAGAPVSSAICRRLIQAMVNPSGLPPTRDRFDYLLAGWTGVSEPLPAAETRLGRRTALTFLLLPPPQKN